MAVLTEERKVTQGVDEREEQGTRAGTRIHERQCAQCRRWFWAWSPERERCYVCDAPPPRDLRRLLDAIQRNAL